MIPDTARLVEFNTALRSGVGDDLPAMLRDVAVATIRDTYARTPDLTLPQAMAWLAVQLWRDKCAAVADLVESKRREAHPLMSTVDGGKTRYPAGMTPDEIYAACGLPRPPEPPDDDTGEFVAVTPEDARCSDVAACAAINGQREREGRVVASIVATTTVTDLHHDSTTITDYQGRRLVPADGGDRRDPNVVVTDRGVMRYDPPVVGPPVPTTPQFRVGDRVRVVAKSSPYYGVFGVVTRLHVRDLVGMELHEVKVGPNEWIINFTTDEIVHDPDRPHTRPSVSSNEPDPDAPTVVRS